MNHRVADSARYVPSQVGCWMPQNDVLGHPRVKAFLSHCGTNSMYEVLTHLFSL